MKNKNQRYGSALQHGTAHNEDHERWTRRSFLKKVGIASGASLLFGNLPVAASMRSPLTKALEDSETDRVLVLIRLKGGNDGLNTIVPLYDYSKYLQYRPTLGLKESELSKLTNAIGIPKTMDPLLSLWEEGQVKVVHNVGYPEQNLSHFRSADIWSSASDANAFEPSGWYGRIIAEEHPDFLSNPPIIPPAIQIGGAANSLFNDEEMTNLAISVQNPEEIAEIAKTGHLFSLANTPDCYYGEQVSFVRSVANNSFFYAGVLSEAYKSSSNAVEYTGALGEQLATVARLIKGNLGTKLYMVTLDGFDTHANQGKDHPQLLAELSVAVRDFYFDLSVGGRDKDVLSMSISEFGRRIEENGSKGTDHGAAAPMMLFGAGLEGSGFVGEAPNLDAVDEVGNLEHTTDFRTVYATVLENWLCLDGAKVDTLLGQSFSRLPELGISCTNQTTSTKDIFKQQLKHEARYSSNGNIQVYYELKEGAFVNVQIINLLGQPVSTLVNSYQSSGAHQVDFYAKKTIAKGQYFYRLQVGDRVYSQPFLLR